MALPTVIIDADQRIVIIRFIGSIDATTFAEGRAALQKESGWSPEYAHVFDFTEVDDIDLSREAIEALAATPPVFDRSAPQILVTRPGSFEFVLARTFQALAAGRRIVHLTESMTEARALLAALRTRG